MARRTVDQTANRDAIVLAAADVLHRRGTDAATMKEIAAAVHLTAGTLYHHFPNKDALVCAVLELGLTEGCARVEAAQSGPGTAADRLERMIAAHIIGLTEQPAIGAAMVFELRTLAGDAAQRTRIIQLRDAFEGLFLRVVREGVASGCFRPVDAAVYVKSLLGAQNWVGVWYRPGGRLTGAQIAARMADMLMHGLAVETDTRLLPSTGSDHRS